MEDDTGTDGSIKQHVSKVQRPAHGQGPERSICFCLMQGGALHGFSTKYYLLRAKAQHMLLPHGRGRTACLGNGCQEKRCPGATPR
eukprot:scaffold58151_cov26-Tisochrysis_lutea.AAC.1